MTTPTPSRSLPHDEVIVIVDFGSQTAQLIARRVREAGAYSHLVSPLATAEEIAALKPKGIILSGGPASVSEPGAPTMDPKVLDLGIPSSGGPGCTSRTAPTCWRPSPKRRRCG